jgi:hypothetical protein
MPEFTSNPRIGIRKAFKLAPRIGSGNGSFPNRLDSRVVVRVRGEAEKITWK